MPTTSELIVERLADLGVTHSFGVVGGAIMYVTDALRKCTRMRHSFTHHEQAAAIAAEAFGKMENRPALVFATAGPGVTNVITGLADAYMDSVPMVLLVGDVRSTIRADFARQRYNAPQEVDQGRLLSPLVKEYLYVEPGMPAADIVAAVDRLYGVAMQGRPGPVCIALPLDAQGVKHPAEALEAALPAPATPPEPQSGVVEPLLAALRSAQRPLLVLGSGIRLGRAREAVRELVERTGLPYCVTIGAVDLQEDSNPLSIGCVGPTSQRCANLAMQAADCIVVLGSSVDQSVTGFNVEAWTKDRTIVMVNVDRGEFLRFQGTSVVPVEADVLSACRALLERFEGELDIEHWRSVLSRLKHMLSPDHERSMRTTVGPGFASAYDITRRLSRCLSPGSTVVLGISLDAHSVFNSFEVRSDQRILVSRNLGPMGWDLPAAIGAAQARDPAGGLYLLTGDGSLMLNLQELAVVCGQGLPLCIFVFNNDGYVSIRTTQHNFFGDSVFGCDAGSGLHMPALQRLAPAFGLEYHRLEQADQVESLVELHRRSPAPRLVECMLDPGQLREPRLVSRVEDGRFITPTLADMTPRLDAAMRTRILELLPSLAGSL